MCADRAYDRLGASTVTVLTSGLGRLAHVILVRPIAPAGCCGSSPTALDAWLAGILGRGSTTAMVVMTRYFPTKEAVVETSPVTGFAAVYDTDQNVPVTRAKLTFSTPASGARPPGITRRSH